MDPLRTQGCHAALRHENGVVVLDFGQPAFHHGGYGTILFSGRFAPNHKITRAMASYASGLRNTKALPEIYNSAMAREWADLARIARARYHRGVHFAGVMTQGGASCNCGFGPLAAHRVLAHALAVQGVGHIPLPVGGTNIVG